MRSSTHSKPPLSRKVFKNPLSEEQLNRVLNMINKGRLGSAKKRLVQHALSILAYQLMSHQAKVSRDASLAVLEKFNEAKSMSNIAKPPKTSSKLVGALASALRNLDEPDILGEEDEESD